MAKHKRPLEAVTGRYTPIPHDVLDSRAFAGTSNRGKALLFELLRQHNGQNNGRLQLTSRWLKARGWTSVDQLQKGKNELIERGLVIKTKLGGLSAGPDLYALTWLPIVDFAGLDIRREGYRQGIWRLMDPAQPIKQPSRSVVRNTSGPQGGAIGTHSGPSHGTEIPSPASPLAPRDGNNECCQFSPTAKRTRVVGKKGRSGKPSRALETEMPLMH